MDKQITLDDWLEAKDGRAAEMARHFKVSDSAVHHWRKNGVPLNRMKAVRRFTGYVVSLESMVPGSDEAPIEISTGGVAGPGMSLAQVDGVAA